MEQLIKKVTIPTKLLNGIPLVCNGGCNIENIGHIVSCANGIIVGVALKRNYQLINKVCEDNTKRLVSIWNHIT